MVAFTLAKMKYALLKCILILGVVN